MTISDLANVPTDELLKEFKQGENRLKELQKAAAHDAVESVLEQARVDHRRRFNTDDDPFYTTPSDKHLGVPSYIVSNAEHDGHWSVPKAQVSDNFMRAHQEGYMGGSCGSVVLQCQWPTDSPSRFKDVVAELERRAAIRVAEMRKEEDERQAAKYELEKKERYKKYITANVPRKFWPYTLENYIPENEIQTKAVQYLKGWTEAVPMVMLSGPIGTGKSSLAASVFKREVARDPMNQFQPIFISEGDVIKGWRARMGARDPQDSPDDYILSLANHPRLLVIDDFGSISMTDSGWSEVWQIIYTREANLLPTIVSSNSNLDEIKNTMGAKMASRLGSGVKIWLAGNDRRNNQGVRAAA